MHNKPPGISDSTLQAIGNTPVVRLHKVVPANSAEVLVKLEYFNPTGSYKDRMALAMIEEAETRGDLRPGMTVVEYTGGSTGSSLAFICAVKGYPFQLSRPMPLLARNCRRCAPLVQNCFWCQVGEARPLPTWFRA
jgi:cysteine synthase